jgi:hypothetical protein
MLSGESTHVYSFHEQNLDRSKHTAGQIHNLPVANKATLPMSFTSS